MESITPISSPGTGPNIKHPTQQPLPPIGREHRVGDMQTEMAKQQAIAKRNAVGTRYNNANFNFSSDGPNYQSAWNVWQVKKYEMSQPDYDACQGHLQAAFTSLNDETNAITTAFGHIGAGDTDRTKGDNGGDAGPPARTALQCYQDAILHYDLADDQCAIAETKHTDCSGHLLQANTYLASYP